MNIEQGKISLFHMDPSWTKASLLWGLLSVDAEAPIFWPPDMKSWHIGKDSDAWKDWKQNGKEAAEDEMVS